MSDIAPDNRRLVFEFVIAAAICGGAYYFLAQGSSDRLGKVQAEIVAAQAKDSARASVGNLSEVQVRDLQARTSQRLAAIRDRSEPASDEAKMFARISELALAKNLRVEQLNPSRTTTGAPAPNLPPGVHAGTPAAMAADPGPTPPKDSSVSYTMTITGAYADISAFLGALPERAGYTLIRAVRITQPDSSRTDQLRAVIESEHFAFDVASIKVPSIQSAAAPSDTH